jgi:hypothetical protein
LRSRRGDRSTFIFTKGGSASLKTMADESPKAQ